MTSKPQDGEMPDECRKEFEDWFSNSDLDCPSLQKSSRCNGDYRLIQTQTAWNVWQGCWNNRTSSIAEGLKEIRDALDFYAQSGNYQTTWDDRSCGCCTDINDPAVTTDEGKKATAALALIDSMIKEAGRE